MRTACGISVDSETVSIVKLTEMEDGSVKIDDQFISTSTKGKLSTITLDRNNQVIINIPSQHTLARFTKLPPVAPERIPDIVRYEADQQIPFDMDEIDWFYHIFETDGPDLEAGIFAVKKEIIDAQLKRFEDAGFKRVHQVQSSSIAVFNCLKHHRLIRDNSSIDAMGELLEENGFIAVLNIEHDASDLIITDGSVFWVRTIPIGLHAFAGAISKEFKMSETKSLALLSSVEESKYHPQIFQALHPVFNDMVQEIQRSVRFFQSTHRNLNITGVRLVGRSVSRLDKFLAKNLGLKLLETPENIATHCVAHGLALQGLGKAEIKENFLETSAGSYRKDIAAVYSKIRIPNFVRQMTLIESMLGISIFLLGILFLSNDNPPNINELPALIDAAGGVSPVETANTTNPYAVIKIETLPDGSVKISPIFHPPFSDLGTNPLSHTMAKNMLEGK